MGDEVGGTRYTTAVGQAVCAVASGVALNVLRKQRPSTAFPVWALGTECGCYVLGALAYGVPQLENWRPYHSRANFLMRCVVVPLLSTHFAIANKYDNDLSYLQLVLAVFPVVAHLINDRHQFELQDAVVGGILAFKAFMHIQTNNYYGLAYCASYALLQFVIGPEGSFQGLSSLDLQSIGCIFESFFIIKALYA